MSMFQAGKLAMEKVSFIMEKGGSGKTSLCTHLSVAALMDNRKVAILDTDPMEGVRAWAETRGRAPEVIPELTTNPAYLRKTVAKCEGNGLEILFIDTPGAHNPIATNVAMLSDLVLVPMKPSPHDTNAIWRTLDKLREHSVPYAVVLSQCPTTTSRPESEMRMILEKNDVPVLDTTIHSKQIVVDSAATGETAFEMDGLTAADRKTIDEFQAVYRWIVDQLGMKKAIRKQGKVERVQYGKIIGRNEDAC
jgi:chromosome partitioning protein